MIRDCILLLVSIHESWRVSHRRRSQRGCMRLLSALQEPVEHRVVDW